MGSAEKINKFRAGDVDDDDDDEILKKTKRAMEHGKQTNNERKMLHNTF